MVTIYDKNGTQRTTARVLKREGTFLNVATVTVTIQSPTVINFAVGDYLVYNGLRYEVFTPAKPKKIASSGSYGNAFEYNQVFKLVTEYLKICTFRDIVPSDNLIHFTTLPTISVFTDVYGIASRIKANLDTFYGSGVWNVRVINATGDLDTLLHTEKNFSISDGSCLDALNQIYDQWKGIGWIYAVENNVNTIVIGRPNIQDSGNTTSTFAYGLGNGLRAITQSVSEKDELATRIYAYGSDRNMMSRYYNKISPSIYASESVYIPNLMIPVSYWGTTSGSRDARKAYIEDASAISTYGLRPKTIIFDGSGDYEEIYPSIEGVTAKNIRDAVPAGTQYRPSSAYADSARMDEVKNGSSIADNGIVDDDSKKYIQTLNLDVNSDVTTIHGFAKQDVVNRPYVTISQSGTAVSGRAKATVNIAGSIDTEAQVISGTMKLGVFIGSTLVVVKETPLVQSGGYLVYEFEDFYFNCIGGSLSFALAADFECQSDEDYIITINVSSGGVKLEIAQTISDVFTIKVKQIGFDISKQETSLSDGYATISMKSGMCGGREFTVKKTQYNELTDDWTLTLARQRDDSLGQYFPNSSFQVASGDRFVILDMMMPSLYVDYASARLYDRASEVLNSLKSPKMTYAPEIDAKVLAETPEIIMEGMYMPIVDADLIGQSAEYILIDSVTISEGESAIPTYNVTLKNEKAESFYSKITKQSKENDRVIKQWQQEDKREDAKNAVDEDLEPIIPAVVIDAPNTMFYYSDDGETTDVVTLTAITQGIDSPSYQWYYMGEEGWVALDGATRQGYSVDPDSEVYFQDGETVEDFRVLVNSTYESRVQVIKVTSGISISLNNPAHIFPAGETTALASTDTVNVLAFNGTNRIVATVGTITGQIAGEITASVSGNETANPIITISVTTLLDTPSGTLTIPVTAGGVTIDLTYSWALALKGTQGSPGGQGEPGDDGNSTAVVMIYQRNSSTPATPSGGQTYTFSTGLLNPVPSEWYQIPPAGSNALYMCQGYAISDTNTATIESWSTPVKFVENGQEGGAGKVMRGPTNWVSGFSYQGLEDTGANAKFVDFVFYNNDATKMYYCKTGHTSSSQELPPSSNKWVEATVQEFVATKVLYSALAYVENLGVNVLKIVKAGTVFGGFMPQNTANEDNGNYILWAGGATPSTAPFRVDKDGKVNATDLNITGGSINVNNAFTVSLAGAMIASGATVNGNITASGTATTYQSENYAMYVSNNGIYNASKTLLSDENQFNSSILTHKHSGLYASATQKSTSNYSAVNVEWGGVQLSSTDEVNDKFVQLSITPNGASLTRDGSSEPITTGIRHIVQESGTHTGTDSNTLYIVTD